MNAAEWGKRLGVAATVAVLVVGLAAAGSFASGLDPGGDEPMALPEYRPENVSVEPLPAEGSVEPDPGAVVGSGTVVIDDAHNNRFDRSDIRPLVEGLTRVGYSVEFYTGGELSAQLEDAKAYVVIDPADEYKPGDVDDVRRFTGQGGRLLIVGEPTRIRAGGGLFGTALTRQESAVTALASSYGVTVDTAYLYNQQHQDGNYKHIVAESADGAVDGVNRTTMYTAASVRAAGGQVLLRSAPETRRSSSVEESGQYPVAVRRGEVVVLGDKSFMATDRYKVADNEAFVAYLVEFLASGDRVPGTDLPGGSETGDGETAGANESRAATEASGVGDVD